MIDGCASAGGNASFAARFTGVVAASATRSGAMLRHNASVIAAPPGCMRAVEGCFVELLRAATAADDAEAAGTGDEVLARAPSGAGDDGRCLLDPPWGGPGGRRRRPSAAARRAATAARDAAISSAILACLRWSRVQSRTRGWDGWLVLKVPRDTTSGAAHHAAAARG